MRGREETRIDVAGVVADLNDFRSGERGGRGWRGGAPVDLLRLAPFRSTVHERVEHGRHRRRPGRREIGEQEGIRGKAEK